MERLQDFYAANTVLVLVFAALTLALIVNEIRQLFRGFKGISPAQLTRLINDENATVIDLRGNAEFERGHITGAKHVLPSELGPEHRVLAKLGKDAPVVLVCAGGLVSAGVAAKLTKAGFTRIAVLDGGIGAWQGANLPLAKGKA
jgi:rhodanese-related sulfurtransferase